MATDRFTQIEEGANTTVQGGVSLLKTAVGLTPLAFGAWYGLGKLKANEAIKVPRSLPTPQQALGKSQGLAARAAQQERNERGVKLIERIRRGLGDADAVKEILGRVEEHNALLHTLSVTLEDPRSGIDPALTQSLKADISRLLSQGSPDSVQEFAERTVKSILDSGSVDTMLKWESNLDTYRKIHGQLEAPDIQIPKTGQAFNKIDLGEIRDRAARDAPISSWERRTLELQSQLGNNNKLSMEVYGFKENGKQFYQAQIYDGKNWQASLALHDHHLVRSGRDLNTMYASPKYALNMQAAHQLTSRSNIKPTEIKNNRLLRNGVMMPYADYRISDLGDRVARGPVDWKAFRDEGKLATQHVTRAATYSSGLGSHIRNQTAIASNVIYGYNFGALSAEEGVDFATRMSIGPGRDAGAMGAKKVVSGFGSERRATLGLADRSGFSELQRSYGSYAIDRKQLPITYRESQVLNRTSMAVDPLERVGGSYIGGLGTLLDQPIAHVRAGLKDGGRGLTDSAARAAAMREVSQGWGTHASGGLNKMIVMDFRKSGLLTKSYGDTGMAITGMSHQVAKPMEFGVLNPAKHGHAASATLKKLLADGGGEFHPADLREDLFVGETGSGIKTLARDPATVAMHAQLDREGISYGKHMIYFKGKQIRKMDFLKVFSLTMKGNIENVGEAGIDNIYRKDSAFGDLMKDLESADVKGMKYKAAYGSSDMLSKGSAGFVHQIAATARMLGAEHSELKLRADSIAAQGGRLGKLGHQIWAQAAFEVLHERGVRPENIGMALAGVWHGAEGSVIKDKKLVQGKHGIDRGSIINMLKERMSGKEVKAATRTMERGLLSFIETQTPGPSVGDFGEGKVGVEHRFSQTAYERLLQIGMKEKDAVAAVTDIYTRKINFGRHYALGKEMLDMGRSITGQRNLADAPAEFKATRLAYEDFGTALSETQTGEMKDFVRKQKHGVVFDFSNAPAHILNPVKEQFGQTSVFMPGEEAFKAGAGTELRVAGGQSKEVSSEFGQLVNSFHKRLAAHATTGGDGLRKALGEWKTNATQMVSRSIAALSQGKIQGSSSPIISTFDLITGAGLHNPKQRKVAARLTKSTGLSAVFGDATMMLSELRTQGATGVSVQELAEDARMFFTGMEHTKTSARLGSGLIRVSGRHPQISAGNVFLTQLFRHPTEVSALGGEDDFFKTLQATELTVFDGKDAAGNKKFKKVLGQDYMNQLFRKDIKSFQDMAAVGVAEGKAGMDLNRKFFRTMIDNINSFSGGQGGGKLAIPKIMTNKGDVGLALQAFMDADGDAGLSLRLGKEHARKVRELMAAQVANHPELASKFQSHLIKNEIGAAIKKGMLAYGEDLVTKGMMSEEDLMATNVMKEVDIDLKTGPLDVRFRSLHEALGNYATESNLKEARAYRDILGSIQENILLKAKHVEAYAPLADEVGLAVQGLMNDPSEASASTLKNFLKDKLFKGASGVFEIGELQSEKEFADYLPNVTRGTSTRITIDGFVAQSLEVARLAKAAGTNVPSTVSGMAAEFAHNSDAMMLHAATGSNMELAGLRAASDSPQHIVGDLKNVTGQMENLFGKMDKRMAAPIALGIGASLMAMGALGTPGYAATPLSAEGEYVPSQVSDAIARGSLFASRDPQITPESFGSRPAGDYGMLDRPINSGTTYMTAPSSYQVRGTLPNGIGLGGAMQYLQGMTGGAASGSVRINDTRRPITSSYADRLMGEY